MSHTSLTERVALVGCTATPNPEPTVTSAAVADPATITLYTSEPQEKIDAIVAAFNQVQPNITVEVFRAGTGDLTARIEAERVSGDVQADILLAADAPTFETYAADGLLLPLSSPEIEAVNPDVVDPDGFYIGTRIIPTVIAYNTDLVTNAPGSWQDLTDPQWADKIAMPNPDISGAAAFNAAVWYNTDGLGETWLQGLAANKPVVLDSNGPVSQAVATGTQPIGVVVDYLVRELAAAGSPIAVSYPSDGVPYVSEPVGIFASTTEEAVSKLFVDFLLSAAGQTIAVSQSYLPVRSDVGTPEGAPALADITILTPDVRLITETRTQAVDLFNSLMG